MKKIVLVLSLLVTAVNLQAQTIVSRKGFSGEYINNTYIKDIDNDMDAFQGIYKYTNGDINFTIQLVKKTSVAVGNHFEDLLIGEVRYKVGLQTLINTLPKINTIYSDVYDHAVVASMIVDNNDYGICIDCTPNEIRMRGSMFDGNRGSAMWLQKEVINGQQALRVNFMIYSSGIRHANDPEEEPIIPGDEYILIKQ